MHACTIAYYLATYLNPENAWPNEDQLINGQL
jgi:hypothetical protein